jgi:hypothetical protein
MDRDLELLTALLLDPCLTTDEAVREAAAAGFQGREQPPAEPRRPRTRPDRGRTATAGDPAWVAGHGSCI